MRPPTMTLASLWFLTLSGLTTGNETAVPTSIQGAIIGKVLPYVQSMRGKDVQLLVVYTADGEAMVGEALQALEKPGVSLKAVELSKLEVAIGAASAVYVLPGAPSDIVRPLCQKSGVLSISAVPELVEKGDFSLGVGIHEGKPQILVNMKELGAEGHRVSSELLKLAKVIP